MWRALVGALAAACLLGVGGILVYFVITAVNGPFGVPLTSPTPDAGQAASQFGAVGFHLRVAGSDRAGGRLRLQLVFTNTSSQQQRAYPQDFTLKTAQGSTDAPVFGPGCPDWGRVDLYPPGAGAEPLRDQDGTKAGPVFGPATLCFADPGTDSGLTLVWEPDVAFGPLSEPIRIPLR